MKKLIIGLLLLVGFALIACDEVDLTAKSEFIDRIDNIVNVTIINEKEINDLLLFYGSFSPKTKRSVENEYTKLLEFSNTLDDIKEEINENLILDLISKIDILLNKSEYNNEDIAFLTNFYEEVYILLNAVEKAQLTKIDLLNNLYDDLVLNEINIIIKAISLLPLVISLSDEDEVYRVYDLFLQLDEEEYDLVINNNILLDALNRIIELKESKNKVDNIIIMINSLPLVISLEQEELIFNLYDEYLTFSLVEKNSVTNFNILENAMLKITTIKEEIASSERVANVIDLISNLPFKVNLSDEDDINEVNNLYKQLNSEEKNKILNYSKLANALIDLANLKQLSKEKFGFTKIGEEYDSQINWNGTDRAIGNSITQIVYNYFAFKEVTGGLILPTNFMDDPSVTFIYTSKSKEFMTDDGEVLKYPILKEAIILELVVNFYGTDSLTRAFTVYIKGTGTISEYMEEGLLNMLKGGVNNNILLPTNYKRGIYTAEVSWRSSNESVLTSVGNYTKPADDVFITLYYSIFVSESDNLEGEVMVLVKGPTDYERAMLCALELESIYRSINTVSEDMDLIEGLSAHPRATISWYSDNEGVLSSTGLFTRPIDTLFISLTATVKVNNATFLVVFSFKANAAEFNTMWEAIEVFLSNLYKPVIGNISYNTFGFQLGYTKNLQRDYGYTLFFENVKPNIIPRMLTSEQRNHPNTPMTNGAPQYVVVHDTGSAAPGAGAIAHANYIIGGSGGSQVSWHFSVGNEGIYQHLPTNYVAWHAGDGSTIFNRFDSGVKATSPKPTITFNWVTRKFVFDGIDTNISLPTSAPTNARMPIQGYYTDIGTNGNWYIGTTYYSDSYNTISNGGGNRNGIGIESCIDYGSDYTYTMQILAKLVANLLFDNKLSIDRVTQHNFHSGKDCPQTMRHAGRWTEFITMVRLELFALMELVGVEFKWTSLSPTILSDTGKVINHTDYATVNYKVEVTYAGETKTYNYSSTLAPFTGVVTDLGY